MKITDKIDLFIEDANRHYNTPVNLPRYKCYTCRSYPYLSPVCQTCNGKGWLCYNEALRIYSRNLSLSDQLPQCHICTRFETDKNPLFAYSIFENENTFKFIYRCKNGHEHDHGMVFVDIHTGLEIKL